MKNNLNDNALLSSLQMLNHYNPPNVSGGENTIIGNIQVAIDHMFRHITMSQFIQTEGRVVLELAEDVEQAINVLITIGYIKPDLKLSSSFALIFIKINGLLEELKGIDIASIPQFNDKNPNDVRTTIEVTTSVGSAVLMQAQKLLNHQ